MCLIMTTLFMLSCAGISQISQLGGSYHMCFRGSFLSFLHDSLRSVGVKIPYTWLIKKKVLVLIIISFRVPQACRTDLANEDDPQQKKRHWDILPRFDLESSINVSQMMLLATYWATGSSGSGTEVRCSYKSSQFPVPSISQITVAGLRLISDNSSLLPTVGVGWSYLVTLHIDLTCFCTLSSCFINSVAQQRLLN